MFRYYLVFSATPLPHISLLFFIYFFILFYSPSSVPHLASLLSEMDEDYTSLQLFQLVLAMCGP